MEKRLYLLISGFRPAALARIAGLCLRPAALARIAGLCLFLVVFAPPVYAQSGPAKISDFLKLMENIIGILAPAAGIAFFIMLLVGGFRFIRSGGDPKHVSEARSTLTYAVIGIVLVVASWLILALIKNFTGVDVTTVTFP